MRTDGLSQNSINSRSSNRNAYAACTYPGCNNEGRSDNVKRHMKNKHKIKSEVPQNKTKTS